MSYENGCESDPVESWDTKIQLYVHDTDDILARHALRDEIV